MRDVVWAAKRGLLLASSSLIAVCGAGTVAQATQPFLLPNTLVVSSTTYDNTQGAVASLTAGQTQLAGSNGAPPSCTTASAGNDYVNVWNNAATDGSFGVTSAITLSDIDPNSGHVHSSFAVPTNQVVTSFSSKSELGLHFAEGSNGPVVSFMAYGGPGVGALDVSNSDAVPGQDPTNPVTGCFGSGSYAFPRTFVTVARSGSLAYTPTIDYGGNNGRSALYSPDAGLYYSVGNANNGNANAYGFICPGTKAARNCTNPDVTQTTGVEAINPLDWPSFNYGTIPSGNSAEADPQFASVSGDKAGKDSNYRGVTEFNGALYFTKGSGSNGIDTVYTVSPGLPSVQNAGSATVSVVPGFPTDVARTTGGNFTPFAVFFANASTMYVTDEGSGNATDTSEHAGLEKWSLVGGTWQLDYVLTNNLIGTQYQLNGSDGAYPAVTTVGLRNLAGKVNANGTVTLWAATSTASGSGDQGADPNEVVVISDQLAATQASQVTGESFGVLEQPSYGSVYRGVAYVTQ